jgi:pimeloyl-ACP methyl ester carboxylesterase
MPFTAGVPIAGDGLELPGVTHRRIDVGGVSLHVALAGEGSGPLVVLLHGFPEFWWSWRYQIPALAEAGFRVAAPDLRGYNLSDQPADVADYSLAHLTADTDGLIRALGEDKAHVVAHDWGAAVAWDFAMRYPKRLDRLAILNVPHPRVMMRALMRSPRQLLRSWYMFFFQLPHLPELIIQQNDYASLRRSLAAGRLVRPGADELEPYVEAARRSESLRGGMNYYRAMFRGLAKDLRHRPTRIEQEVLVIWGERDIFLGRELSVPPAKLVPRCRVEYIPEASHWVQVDAPRRVNSLLIPFLKG